MLLLFIFFFGTVIALFIVISMAMAANHMRTFPVRSVRVAMPPLLSVVEGLPPVPQTLAQLRSAMDDKQFEYFSAALVIALGEGHRFHSRVGGAGDWGIDTKLRNLHGNIVIVQAKFFQPGDTVKPSHVRDFMGSITFAKAVYGFFVTTSEFSKQARDTAEASRGRIRTIDGRQIEVLLQHRSREIALAMRDIQAAMPVE